LRLATLLQIPDDAKPIAILCIGHVNTFYKEPMLVETGWKEAKPLAEMVMENTWVQVSE
jgi:5,6-dimethylbenzimidazole synthase